MSQPTDETPEPVVSPDWAANPEPPAGEAPSVPAAQVEVEEEHPDGGRAESPAPPVAATSPPPEASTPQDDDGDEPPPQLVWYVLKVQSSREDTIRDALERRVKIQGGPRVFGGGGGAAEKNTENRHNKKRRGGREKDPRHIIVEVGGNEKDRVVVRGAPGGG